MASALGFGMLCFSSLLTIIDPLAAAPMFVTLTNGADSAERRRIAIRACMVSLGLLLLFAIGGGFILRTFGITIDAFRIAGGILFVVMSIKMLTGAEKEAPDGEAARSSDPAIFPLGMPIICGPGAISTVMVLMGQSSSGIHVVSLLLAILAVIAVTAAFLMVSPAALRLVGRSGVHIVTQVMGLIVCVIGIQFIINGVRPVVLDMLSSVR